MLGRGPVERHRLLLHRLPGAHRRRVHWGCRTSTRSSRRPNSRPSSATAWSASSISKAGLADVFASRAAKLLFGFLVFTWLSIFWAYIQTYAVNAVRPLFDYLGLMIITVYLLDRGNRAWSGSRRRSPSWRSLSIVRNFEKLNAGGPRRWRLQGAVFHGRRQRLRLVDDARPAAGLQPGGRPAVADAEADRPGWIGRVPARPHGHAVPRRLPRRRRRFSLRVAVRQQEEMGRHGRCGRAWRC